MKNIITSILIAILLIAGAFMFSKGNSADKNPSGQTPNGEGDPSSNVSVRDGIQIIEIKARGGYSPRKSVAQAGLPTILRVNTDRTFDCSSALRIPALKVSRNLPISGVTDIEIPSPSEGSLRGSCSMGMYSFEVVFQN